MRDRGGDTRSAALPERNPVRCGARGEGSGAPLGIRTLRGEGAYGTFEGAAEDEVVFAHYLREGEWSPEVLRVLVDQLFAQGRGTFLDVGANIGLVSIPLVEQRRVRCFAFEPEPRNFAYLSRNIEAHGLASLIETFNVALYSEARKIPFALSPNNFGDHRVRRPGATRGDALSSRRVIEVPAERLDDLLTAVDLPRPIVMKVDTQGCEVRVFEGAERFLASLDYLIAEYWPKGLLDMGDSARSFIEVMRRFSHGEVIGPGNGSTRLRPVAQVFADLAWVPTDGSDDGFFDILVANHASCPS